MQMREAVRSDSSQIWRAESWLNLSSTLPAACAKGPPEPMAATPSSGSMTSPVPERMRVRSLSATRSKASSLRRKRSVRQSLASSTAARGRLRENSLSLAAKRSNSVKASAVAPAKPASTCPSESLRSFFAPCLRTVLSRVTWPSDPRATFPSRRTQTTVVARSLPIRASEGGYANPPARRRHQRLPQPPVAALVYAAHEHRDPVWRHLARAPRLRRLRAAHAGPPRPDRALHAVVRGPRRLHLLSRRGRAPLPPARLRNGL